MLVLVAVKMQEAKRFIIESLFISRYVENGEILQLCSNLFDSVTLELEMIPWIFIFMMCLFTRHDGKWN